MKQATGTFNTAAQNFSDTSQAPHFSAAPRKRSLWDRLWGGPAAPFAEPSSFNDESAHAEPHTEPGLHNEDEGWGVVVQKPARTPLEAFKDTISEGTRLFCEQNVHPLYVEDKQTKFRVTGIKMYAPKGASQLISIIENLPIDVRNRLARGRAEKAPGAAEQLVFDDGFFGISLDIEPPVIDGQQIRLIAAWTGGSVEIKLVFTGQYITVKRAPEPQSPPQNAPVQDAPMPAVDTVSTPVVAPQASIPSKDTPLGIPVPSAKTGSDTPMGTPPERIIGRIHILPFGAAHETVVNINPSMLPYVLGREHTSTGRFVHGCSLGSELDESIGRLVSREHFELKRFDEDEGRFYVVNHAVERNGSYFNGSAVPERFNFRAEAPKNTFVLGGTDGVGTVRITIEAT